VGGRIFALAALFALALPQLAAADAVNLRNRTSAVGMNLQRHYSFQPQLPFLNVLKMAEAWRETPAGGGACNQTNQPYSGATDANGYPTELGNRVCLHTRLLPSDYASGHWPLGTWVLRYEGSASFAVLGSGSGLAAAGAGRATFSMAASPGGFRLAITALDPADPPRNLRVYPPGGVCAKRAAAPYDFEPWGYCSNSRCQGGACEEARACSAEYPVCVDLEEAAEAGGATFHPLWLERLRGYRTLRFMDWLHTNHSSVVDYADWLGESAWSWEYRNHPGNVPLAVVARLCNTLNAECWVNLPHQATDAAIAATARALREAVAAHLPVILEYSNEVWNGIFTQNGWARAAADALPDGVFDGTGCLSGSGQVECENSFTGMRTYQMCAIAEAEFAAAGQAGRLTCVLARQASDANKLARSLDCPRWRTSPQGNCYAGSAIDAVAVAPYFGDDQDCAEAASVAELMARIEADLANEYCLGPSCFMRRQFDVLAARGLSAWPLLAYEGGSHQADASRQVCVDAVTDARLREAYLDALDLWKDHADVGGHPIRSFVAFNSLSDYGLGGSLFGARGSWAGERSVWPKEAGLLDWAEAPGNQCWWPGCAIPPPAGTSVGECADGVDNDGDGRVDYPADLQCSSASDPSERAAMCGLGFEVALVAVALRALARRRSRA
jgi:hypothetical protein